MKETAKIRTVIVDLDRTLLHTDKTLSDYTIGVFKACKDRGMQIMVATARPLRTAKQYCDWIGADAMVVSNGARILCGSRRTEYGISPECAEHLLRGLARRPSLLVTLETGDVAYSNRPIADYETTLSDDLAGVARAEGVLKILVNLEREDTLEFVRSMLTEELYCTVANGHLIQIMSKTATKWNGIRAMLALSHRSPAEAIYFGDDNDDIEPLRRCGLGVAVANGIEAAKAAADAIAESNDADGVAKYLENLLKSE